jgi:hypothetical protein
MVKIDLIAAVSVPAKVRESAAAESAVAAESAAAIVSNVSVTRVDRSADAMVANIKVIENARHS